MEPSFSYREIARLTFAGTYSQREIAAAVGCSPASVANVQKRMRAIGIDEDAALKLSDQELRGLLNRDRGPKPGEGYMQPDYADVQRQLEQHKGLTLAILWEEYAKRCAVAGRQAYLYSYFVEKYNAWASASDIALKARHVPGDKMEVDWAGTTMEFVDPYTGEVHEAYLFVATLPYSQYTFVKPTESMGSDAWIECNIAALRFFGGVPRIIVPDNLKCTERHLQLSGTRIGVEPPKNANACTWAVILCFVA